MRVIATKLGFSEYLRQPGDEFEVPDGVKGSWFKPLKDDAEKAPKGRKAADANPSDSAASLA
jgi:hypothetical protein